MRTAARFSRWRRTDGLRNGCHIARVEAGDGDTPVAREVDRVLRRELVAHRCVHPGEGEHADLVGDVRPLALRARRLPVYRGPDASNVSYCIGCCIVHPYREVYR